jgi:hypothetical protein
MTIPLSDFTALSELTAFSLIKYFNLQVLITFIFIVRGFFFSVLQVKTDKFARLQKN